MSVRFILANYVQPRFIPTRSGGNATYITDVDKTYLLCRETNYVYAKSPSWATDMGHEANYISMYRLNDHSNIIRSHEALYECNNNAIQFIKYLTKSTGSDWGFEDPRYIQWNDKPYLLFSRRDPNNWAKFNVCYGYFTKSLDFQMISTQPGKMQVEKNWQPIEAHPGICMYLFKPLTTINLFNNTYTTVHNHNLQSLRGSSNIIKYKDGYLGIYHRRDESFRYVHYLVWFDENLHIVQISKPFSFLGAMIEFNCYLGKRNNDLVVLLSVHDQILYEFVISETTVSDIYNDKLIDYNNTQKWLSTIYQHAVSVKNVAGALAIATFSNDPQVLCDALIRCKHDVVYSGIQMEYVKAQLLDNWHTCVR